MLIDSRRAQGFFEFGLIRNVSVAVLADAMIFPWNGACAVKVRYCTVLPGTVQMNLPIPNEKQAHGSALFRKRLFPADAECFS